MIFRRKIFFLLVLAAGFSCSAAQASPATLGQPAPKLVVRQLDGAMFNLASFRGRVLVVNFWASWCPPCRAEMPALDSFYRHYRDRGVGLIALSADRAPDRAAAQEAMAGLSYPAALLDDATVNGFDAPDVLPVTYVIDAKGEVRAVLWPLDKALDEQTLAAVVEPLLPPGK